MSANQRPTEKQGMIPALIS